METKLILFANLKGGVGKSTLTNWAAVNFYHNTDCSVLVLDGDMKQQSIVKCRNRNEAEYKGETPWEDVPMYDLLPMEASNFLNKYLDVIDGNYDIVLFDVPGSVESDDILNAYMMADVIIVPSSHGDMDIDSSNEIIEFIKNTVIPKRKAKDLDTQVYWLLNKVSMQLKSVKEIIETAETDPMFEGIPLMKSYIPNLPAKAQVSVNTVDFGEDMEFYNKYIKPWGEEILSIMGVKSLEKA